jgi:hypothetical protein
VAGVLSYAIAIASKYLFLRIIILSIIAGENQYEVYRVTDTNVIRFMNKFSMPKITLDGDWPGKNIFNKANTP